MFALSVVSPFPVPWLTSISEVVHLFPQMLMSLFCHELLEDVETGLLSYHLDVFPERIQLRAVSNQETQFTTYQRPSTLVSFLSTIGQEHV